MNGMKFAIQIGYFVMRPMPEEIQAIESKKTDRNARHEILQRWQCTWDRRKCTVIDGNASGDYHENELTAR
jgi:hypothetical protein